MTLDLCTKAQHFLHRLVNEELALFIFLSKKNASFCEMSSKMFVSMQNPHSLNGGWRKNYRVHESRWRVGHRARCASLRSKSRTCPMRGRVGESTRTHVAARSPVIQEPET